jgi:hypothetical protein
VCSTTCAQAESQHRISGNPRCKVCSTDERTGGEEPAPDHGPPKKCSTHVRTCREPARDHWEPKFCSTHVRTCGGVSLLSSHSAS